MRTRVGVTALRCDSQDPRAISEVDGEYQFEKTNSIIAILHFTAIRHWGTPKGQS